MLSEHISGLKRTAAASRSSTVILVLPPDMLDWMPKFSSGTRVEVAVGALFAWAAEQQRQSSGGVRGVLVPDPASRRAGAYVEFAVSLS